MTSAALRALLADNRPRSVAEIVAATGVSRKTARAALRGLTGRGVIRLPYPRTKYDGREALFRNDPNSRTQ
jgi:DNA-binding Lrp family transcriptional regulator